VSETCLYQMANSCTLALFEAGTADTEPSTAEYRRLTYRKCFQKKQVNQDEPCTDIQQDENVCTMYRQVCNMYIPTTHTYIQIKMQISLFIQSSSLLVYILLQNLFIHCTYQVHTLNVQVYVFMCIEHKSKKLHIYLDSNSQPCAY